MIVGQGQKVYVVAVLLVRPPGWFGRLLSWAFGRWTTGQYVLSAAAVEHDSPDEAGEYVRAFLMDDLEAEGFEIVHVTTNPQPIQAAIPVAHVPDLGGEG